ncbi:Predicted metalloprotease, contains C-terminal PDZ domain [Dyella jiangningensis]|uniref:M61 family metallopeptidase n=1 Tax=Dyella sp. AtDHG13 TaxID=1938897 RepID=UPI00088A9B96|nr:M61 family metallopeptidase [Dyella sp. AtDHG13]PXV55439.1 putative metalloprotease with PDZ domain [Dyella sp. AtDHG13]SDK76495.1 Predicted metalloprotease, contains C-terminal PDZ domain [Dyella jiangningensis]
MKRLTRWLAIVILAACAPWTAQADEHAADGIVALTVRLPDPSQKLLYVHETMPVTPGPLTLYYPKWIPGDHSPDGPIELLMGLQFSAGGQRMAWQRDELDRFTFHLDVPAGVRQLDIDFQFPGAERVTPHLMGVSWDQVALYRAGSPTNTQIYQPTLIIPADWHHASALETATQEGGRIAFKPVPFNTLVDSPVIAGQYFRQIDLTPAGSTVRRYLDMVGDNAAALDLSDAQIASYRRLIEQAQRLFHSHHYDSYHLLLTLSDYVPVGGLEHHQSSDDRARSGSKMFADADHFMLDASLLPHEYTHSWNGKFMRPAGLWQPDFEQPERPGMLWIYEGLTVYLGDMLTARSGLWSADTWRQVLAYRAADMAYRPGRAWRPLTDTAVAVDYSAPTAWGNWRRQNDFYREGELLWLAIDMRIRELSHGKRSVDDFARLFFSVDDGSYVTHTYGFDDVVDTLGKVQPDDWASFLHGWIDGVDDQVPLLSGIEASGWQLAYTDQPSRYQHAIENVGQGELEVKGINAMFSLGLFLKDDGDVIDVLWNGPAFKAGMAPGMKLVSINDRAFSASVLHDEMARAQQSRQLLQLRVKNDGVSELHVVHYVDGPKYPNLVRAPGKPDVLREILAPRPGGDGP